MGTGLRAGAHPVRSCSCTLGNDIEVIAHLARAPFTTGVVLPVDGGAGVGA